MLQFFDDILPDVCNMFPQEKSAPLLPEGTVKFTYLVAQEIHRGRQLK